MKSESFLYDNEYNIKQMNKTDQVINYKDLQKTLDNIKIPEHRVMLKTTYMTLGRVGEIVRGRYKNNPPLQKSNFETSNNLLITKVLTEKSYDVRRVPCSRIDDDTQEYFKNSEAWLTEDIIEYVDKSNKPFLWDKSTRWAQYIFNKYFPEYNNHIHLLRHWRASHLLSGKATGKPVPERIVAKMGGWTGTKTLTATYDKTVIEDYVDVK